MNKTDIIVLSLIFICIFILVGLVVSAWEVQDNACKKIGFEKYTYQSNSFCEDKEGNLYYVKMDCNEWYWPFQKMKCVAKQIKVGEVFGKLKDE